jgi:hypothetical protein
VATRAAGRISEKVFTGQVVQLARMLGWRVYHPWLSVHSAAGFPDLVLCRPPRLIVAELKVGRNVPTPAQHEWLDALRACGAEMFVWYPEDMQAIGDVLAA